MTAENKSMPRSLKCKPGDAAETSIETSLQTCQTVVIGRGQECDVVVADAKASRRHCRLTRGENSFVLEDLGSKNGTFVDGKRIEAPVSLKVSQTFKLGDTIFYLS